MFAGTRQMPEDNRPGLVSRTLINLRFTLSTVPYTVTPLRVLVNLTRVPITKLPVFCRVSWLRANWIASAIRFNSSLVNCPDTIAELIFCSVVILISLNKVIICFRLSGLAREYANQTIVDVEQAVDFGNHHRVLCV